MCKTHKTEKPDMRADEKEFCKYLWLGWGQIGSLTLQSPSADFLFCFKAV